MATGSHWFEAVADHLGPAYLRYSFTMGTAQEVEFLLDALDLAPGARVLDVGCGPGRHARGLAERGLEVVGVDIAQAFIDLARTDAPAGARFERMDARDLTFDGEFDAAISLCQGAFGLVGGPAAADQPGGPAAADRPGGPATAHRSDGPAWSDPDGEVLAGMARAVRPGGRVAVSAFSAYFQVRYLEDFDTFDADLGVNHERTTVRDVPGAELEVDLWTSCFTPRELRLLASASGLVVEHLWSVTPGAYARTTPDLDHPEFLVIAHRPG